VFAVSDQRSDTNHIAVANVALLDDAAEIENPDGISRDFVLDFLAATLSEGKTNCVLSVDDESTYVV
jgi:hypothetical protein